MSCSPGARAVAWAVRWAALAACCVVLILAFAVFSAVLMDLLAVFTVPLAVADACLMVLRPLSTVLMLFFPRSSLDGPALLPERPYRLGDLVRRLPGFPRRLLLGLFFRLFGCGFPLLDFLLDLGDVLLGRLNPLAALFIKLMDRFMGDIIHPSGKAVGRILTGGTSSAYRLWSALSLVRIYASFIRSEATAALSIALMPFSQKLLFYTLPMASPPSPGGPPYSSSSLATTTIRPLVREYSQVERVMSWSPYSAVTPVS